MKAVGSVVAVICLLVTFSGCAGSVSPTDNGRDATAADVADTGSDGDVNSAELPGDTADDSHPEETQGCTWDVLTHEFPTELTGLSTGDWNVAAFENDPVPVDAKYSHYLGFRFTPMMPPWMKPEPSSGPVVLYSDSLETLVVSPMENFGAAWISFEDGNVRTGMHGDVDGIPAGTVQRFIFVEGKGINGTLQCWGKLMRESRNSVPPDRYADTGLSYPGYWTDNGAAYYYATAPGMNESQTLLAVRDEAVAKGIPYGYFQLDSWWYFKEKEGSLSPGGLLSWSPHQEMFPDGLAAFRSELGLPLIAHNRWISVNSDYLDAFPFEWDSGSDMAIPTDAGVYREFMQSCVDWGIETYEQDWLVRQYWGSSWLRSQPGRLEAWLGFIHDSAREKGLTTQLCMTGAAHLLDAVDHDNVTTVRTSIDYSRDVCKECYWPQFHTVNMVARALGVWPFKDNFHSSEKFGEAEALISALSAGMVGVGDELGATVADIVMKTCRADGMLLKPDRPATPVDTMFLPHERPFTVSTESSVPGLGTWTYLAAFLIAENHPERTDNDRLWVFFQYEENDLNDMFIYPDEVVDWSFDASKDVGIRGERVLYDWRTGTARVVGEKFDLPPIQNLNDFDYLVLAPIQSNGLALIGETGKFVTMADRRFKRVEVLADRFDVELEGAVGEKVAISAFDTVSGKMLPPVETVVGSDGRASLSVGR